MRTRSFTDWDNGLSMDYDKELWPFVRKMDVWIWEKIIDDEWVDGGHNFTVLREDLKGLTGRIIDIQGHLTVWSWRPSISYGQQLSYNFTILRVHTKGGVVLKTSDDIKSFLLL